MSSRSLVTRLIYYNVPSSRIFVLLDRSGLTILSRVVGIILASAAVYTAYGAVRAQLDPGWWCFYCFSLFSASTQSCKFFNRQTRICNDAAKCPHPNLFVVRHNRASIGFNATKNHVPAGLSSKYEPDTLQNSANFAAGQISRKFFH